MSKKVRGWGLLLGLAIFLMGTACLAMPPKKGLLEPDPVTGLSKLTGKLIVPPPRPAGLDAPEPFKAELVTGTNQILLIVIDYPDLGSTQTANSFDDMVNDSSWQDGCLNDYYQEVSYNQFGVNGVTVGWYQAANNHTYYANNDGIAGTNDDYGLGGAAVYPHNAVRLVEEAVDAAEAAGVDFSNYDNDGDGEVDTVFVIHAGMGGEATGNPDDIWSHKWSISSGGGTARTYDGVTIDTYNVQPELNSAGGHIEIGVFAHEYGHVLGLPDLYDTVSGNGDSEGIGNWGLMAGGSWGGDGLSPEKPSHMCAWSKVYLGWLTPTVIEIDTSDQQISQIETNAEVYKLWRNGKPDKEYFLVSNRQQTGFDENLPGGGLLIWHIDEDVIDANMGTNSVNGDENHKGVDLEEADGNNDLDGVGNRGDAGDPFPGSTNNTTFDQESNPNSKSYANRCTGVEVTDISASGDPMTADIKVTIYAVTDPYYDDIGAVLESMGYKTLEIQDSELADLDFISQFDVIFINCSGDASYNAPGAETSLQQFVQDGGAIYASDFAFAYVDTSFPGNINFGGYIGKVQNITATVIDPGLATYLGTNSVPIYYDLGGWVPIVSLASGTTELLRGTFDVYSSPAAQREKAPEHSSGPGKTETWENKPLAAYFYYGDGMVLYTSFHNEAQTQQVQKLMQYFVLKPLVAKITKILLDTIQNLGYLVALETASSVNQGGTSSFTYEASGSENLVFGIGWGGSTLKLSVYNPDGDLYAEEQSDTSPITIEVPNAASGRWEAVVTGVDVPYDNYPFAGVVGATAGALEGLRVYPNPFNRAEHTQIIFEGLTSDAKIRIFTLSGELVQEVEPGESIWEWDVKNQEGENLARGVYVYVVTGAGGSKRIGKIAVISAAQD